MNEITPEVRIDGVLSDYIDGIYTGKDIAIDIIWLYRNHDYSSTKLKRDIYNNIKGPAMAGLNYD